MFLSMTASGAAYFDILVCCLPLFFICSISSTARQGGAGGKGSSREAAEPAVPETSLSPADQEVLPYLQHEVPVSLIVSV